MLNLLHLLLPLKSHWWLCSLFLLLLLLFRFSRVLQIQFQNSVLLSGKKCLTQNGIQYSATYVYMHKVISIQSHSKSIFLSLWLRGFAYMHIIGLFISYYSQFFFSASVTTAYRCWLLLLLLLLLLTLSFHADAAIVWKLNRTRSFLEIDRKWKI